MNNKDFFSFIKLFDDDYIISLSNKGYLKRAKKDYEKNKDNIKVLNENPLTLDIMGNTVIFEDINTDSVKCSCPDSKFCRHRITAIFYLRDYYFQNNENEERADEENIEDNFKELLNFDLKELEKHFTKRLFLKGADYFLKANISKKFTDNSLDFIFKNDFDEKEIVFSFKSVNPLDNKSCSNPSCKGNSYCIHQIAALLYYLTENSVIKKEDIANLLKTDIKVIDENLLTEIRDMFLDMIDKGLTSVTKSDTEKLRKYSFKIHYEIPTFENLLKNLEKELNYFISKNPKFNFKTYRHLLIKFFRILNIYNNDKKNYKMISSLTENRSKYEEISEITLYCIGREYVKNNEVAFIKNYFYSEKGNIFTKTQFISAKSENKYSNYLIQLKNTQIWEGIRFEDIVNRKIILKKTAVNRNNAISSVVKNIQIKEKHNFNNFKYFDDFVVLRSDYLKFKEKNEFLSIDYSPFIKLIKPFYYDLPYFDYETQSIYIELYDENNVKTIMKFVYPGLDERKKGTGDLYFKRILDKFKEEEIKPDFILGKLYTENKIFYISPISFFYSQKEKIVSPQTDW